MSRLKAPVIDPRRARDFERELLERAAVWMPGWDAEASRDFGRALAKIAARFDSEVAERLDLVGDKMRGGFLDWLAVRGQAARPARMPIVFQMAPGTAEPVFARAPIRMQAEAAGASVAFESETDVRVIPGRLVSIVAVDADEDHVYLPPPGLTTIEPPEPAPDRWTLTSFAAPRSPTLQVDPPEGLAPEMVLEIEGAQYRVTKAANGLVTIDPPVPAGAGFAEQTEVRKVTTFAPFERTARDWQEHALYLGDPDLLNLDAGAVIDVVGAGRLGTGYAWEYWGKDKSKDNEIVTWQPLKVVDDPAPPAGLVRLRKGEGAIEPCAVGSVESARWIRAVARTQVDTPFVEEALQLRINCVESDATPATDVQAMADTTALPERTFFPLGREPRLFDAFYLASSEAFSKKGAEVTLDFQMADPAVTSFAVIESVLGPPILAGIGRDHALHLLELTSSGSIKPFQNRQLLQPPTPEFGGAAAAASGFTPLDGPFGTLPTWMASEDFLVATSSKGAVWVWRERSGAPAESGWISFGMVPAADLAIPLAGLVHLDASSPMNGRLVALRAGRLAVHDMDPTTAWRIFAPSGTSETPTLSAIVPIRLQASLRSNVAEGIVGLTADGGLYFVALDYGNREVTLTRIIPTGPNIIVDPSVAPVAIQTGVGMAGLSVVAFMKPGIVPRLIRLTDGAAPITRDLANGTEVVGATLTAALDPGSRVVVLATVREDGRAELVSWMPFEAALEGELFFNKLPGSATDVGGAPAATTHIVVPGAGGDAFVARLDWENRITISNVTVETGIVIPRTPPALDPDDLAIVDATEDTVSIEDFGEPSTGPDVFHPAEVPGSAPDFDVPAPVYAKFAGKIASSQKTDDTITLNLELEPQDNETATALDIVIDAGSSGRLLFTVTSIATGTPRVAALKRVDAINAQPTPGLVAYWHEVPVRGRVVPFVRLDPAANPIEPSLLDRSALRFDNGSSAAKTTGRAFLKNFAGKSTVVVLDTDGQIPDVGAGWTLVIDAAVEEWSRQFADEPSNPALAWEYWDGSSWSHLPLKKDETQHLKSSGNVVFEIPAGLTKGEWGGKEDFWIRARLIGGDYGREVVSVTTSKPDGDGNTTQTYGRSTEGIRAPIVQQLLVTYEVCKEVTPKFLVTQDSGSSRDQSDANRTAGAFVEAFVPVGTWLARLGAPADTATTAEEGECCADDRTCGCETAAASSSAVRGVTSAPRAIGRSIFLGFDANLSGETINVLLQTAREGDYSDAAPLTVEALVGGRLMRLNVDDDTRGLGESGILTLSFPEPPQRTAIFGGSPLCWIRLAPARVSADWAPSLRGAHLNAVWASATETMTRELLGSSEGAPNLELRLARPPLLDGTLELRVREPLGEEQLRELRKDGPDRVRSDVADLPGHWVLWERVVDPGDEEPTKRVYALDEATGRVRFGDGRRGMIPPIGRDAIVAFRYQRTEPPVPGATDVPANAIAARAQINLVTPVAGVEAAFSADPAAGGAPPDPAARVLRFGSARTRHRGRAVTMRDLEDLALASSPEFVQARALRRGRGLTLVVVRRGADPIPSAVQKRELKRHLLGQAPAALTPASLGIDGPTPRTLRIALTLGVATLDDAAAVAEAAKRAIEAFLDPAGDDTRDGWQLGVSPSVDDVAFALLDLPRLVNVEAIALFEVRGGRPQPWSASLAPHEIAVLAADGIRFEFHDREAAT